MRPFARSDYATCPARRRARRVAEFLFTLALALLVPATNFSYSSAFADSPQFQVRGSVKQVFVIGAPAEATFELRDASGTVMQTGTTDALGGLIFRNVPPGDGYVVTMTSGAAAAQSDQTTVLSEDYVPPPSFYAAQALPTGTYGHSGYGYLTTRDGTQLSVQVQLPEGPGPFPALVEYSGYDPSNPTPDNIASGQVQPFRLIANLFGYAYVGVNIRGTGCSGGGFDYFEFLQSLDGYDAIETVAAQPWVRDGRVAMVGISYPGISQLFVAQTRPPHLVAITPLSVIDDTFRSTLYPGGIFNDGFALNWAMQRQKQNRWPDPAGADWVIERVRGGDAQCAANQLLRQQSPDLLQKIQRNPYYPAPGNSDYPAGGELLTPYSFINRINVPTYIAGAWQDEQTGGHWAVMLDRFAPDTFVRIEGYNGAHADALGPNVLFGLLEFLDFFVAQRIPRVPNDVRFVASLLYPQVFGASGIRLPADRFTGFPYDRARALYEAEDRVHILWEVGAKPDTRTLGSPEPSAESSYTQWPPREAMPAIWYLQPDGRLSPNAPSIRDDEPRGADSYLYDPTAKPRSTFHCPGDPSDPNPCSEAIWKANAVYDWRPTPDGNVLSFISDPFPSQVTILGSGSVDLWLKSTAADTDLEVTVTEVRPDGWERYVQNGWLRASQRTLDEAGSTVLRPRHTHLQRDAEPLPAGQFVLVRVELFPFGHVFRAGSRLRISIEAPGGNRPLWTFDVLKSDNPVTNWITHSVGRPSRAVLPVIPNVEVPAALPPCPTSLRSQPCRQYVAPGAPTEATAELNGSNVKVSWTAAQAPAGKTITGYTVTAAPGGATRRVGNESTSATFNGLAPGRYSFMVVANYDNGQSPASTPSNTVSMGSTLTDVDRVYLPAGDRPRPLYDTTP